MKLPLKKYVNTTPLIIITVPLILLLSCLLFLTPLAAFTVSLYAFYFCRLIRKLTAFFTTSGVDHSQHNQDQFRFHNTSFSSQLKSIKSKVDSILVKDTSLRINLNIDDAPIASHTLAPPTPATHEPLASYSLPSP